MSDFDELKDWFYRCSKCGTCKYIFNQYVPNCPSGERFLFESYFGSGKILIGRGLVEKRISFDDESLLKKIYTCTGCGSCEEQCTAGVREHIVEIVMAIRTKCIEGGMLISEHTMMIDGLKKEDNVFSEPKAERGKWAEGLDVKDINRNEVDVIFHSGCRFAYDEELRNVVRGAVTILKNAGVDVGIAGSEEACCGGRAYEIGYRGELTKYAEDLSRRVKASGAKKLVTACSDCYYTFKRLYPMIGQSLDVEVLHITKYIDDLIKEGRIKPSKDVKMKVTYHDPCHLGRRLSKDQLYEKPRSVLKSISGLELIEMDRIRQNAWCCGAGAGVMEAYPDFAIWTAKERILEAKETGAKAIVTACPWCERNFKDAIKEMGGDLKVYDVVELLGQAV